MNSRTATYAAVGAFVAVRLWLLPWHSMALWGLNPQRFLAPPLGWLTGLLMFAAFLPPFGRELAAACDSAGDRLARSRRDSLIAAALFASVVFLLDDRTLFTGDALIRNAASDAPGFLARFQQALPLELFLYERLPLALASYGFPATLPARLLGAASAFALALAGIALGREFARRGAMLLAVACITSCGGWLVAFTGLGKPAALLCALTALAAVYAVRVARTGRGTAALGVTIAFAILLHRAGVFLVPCWIVAMVFSQRHRAAVPAGGQSLRWAIACLPVLSLVLMATRLVRIATSIDAPLHLLTARSAPGPWRGLDLFNLSLAMCPAAIPILIGGMRRPFGWARSRSFAVACSLLAPWLLLAIIAQPAQGIFRDADFFAPGGVALAICMAWVLCELPGIAPLKPQLPATVACVCIFSALQLLLCWHDPRAGMARVGAYLSESPRRSAAEQERGWDFIALRALATGDWKTAAIACDAAAKLAPNPRMLIMLGVARTYLGDWAAAKQAYSRVLERSPHELVAWAGLAGIAKRLGDRALADSAQANMRRVPPGSLKARELQLLIAQYPEFSPKP